MKKRMVVMPLLLLGMLLGFLALCGCNTWEGAGKDVERAGEKMQGEE